MIFVSKFNVINAKQNGTWINVNSSNDIQINLGGLSDEENKKNYIIFKRLISDIMQSNDVKLFLNKSYLQ